MLAPTPTPDASQWNIGGVGPSGVGAGVGHVHFRLFVSISFALANANAVFSLSSILYFFHRFFLKNRSSSALHRLSSGQILLDHWATFCREVPNVRFLVTAGFEPTSLSSRCGCFTTTLARPPNSESTNDKNVCYRFLILLSTFKDMTV